MKQLKPLVLASVAVLMPSGASAFSQTQSERINAKLEALRVFSTQINENRGVVSDMEMLFLRYRWLESLSSIYS